jgi:hypothetical protein
LGGLQDRQHALSSPDAGRTHDSVLVQAFEQHATQAPTIKYLLVVFTAKGTSKVQSGLFQWWIYFHAAFQPITLRSYPTYLFPIILTIESPNQPH